jgi:hypothetical protein
MFPKFFSPGFVLINKNEITGVKVNGFKLVLKKLSPFKLIIL